jgi:hypothetical protein
MDSVDWGNVHHHTGRMDPKAVSLVKAISDKDGQPYTLTSLANETHISTTEVSRYLRESSFEPRDFEWMTQVRKYNKTAYMHYLTNHYPEERNGKQVFMVNFSKYAILEMVAGIMGLQLVKAKNLRGTSILHTTPVENKTLIFETPEYDFTIDEESDSWDE